MVLQVEDLKALDDRHNLVLDGVSFEVRTGEVLGVAGVQAGHEHAAGRRADG